MQKSIDEIKMQLNDETKPLYLVEEECLVV